MAHKIGVYYDESGMRAIMKGHEIQKIEEEIMQRKLAQVRAEFLQTFGVEGDFELKAVATNSRRSRITYRIVAASAQTTHLLKKQPGWLGKFL